MQDIDQNMDDLFRKAATDYPLKLNESHWDDIAPLVVQSPLNGVVAPKGTSGKYAGLLAIFLVILLTTGLMTNTFKPDKQTNLPSSQAENIKSTQGISNETVGYTNNKIAEKKLVQQKHYTDKQTLKSPINYTLRTLKKESIQKQTNKNDVLGNDSDQLPESKSGTTNLPAADITEATTNIALVIKQETIVQSKKSAPVIDTVSQTENQSAIKNTSLKNISGHYAGIYFGFVAGPLFDEVKNQGLKKTGFSAGIIAGYQFKNHLSIETGLLYAQKPYFSTGKYFKMDKIGNSMPAGMEILSLEGNSYLLEIPVKMKYDFLFRKKSNFFLSAGITSYALTHEKNNYLVFMNGTQQSMISSYKNQSRSLAASFDISAGYEHILGKSNRIRIEPYLQIPLGGMGVGSMPMMSSGFRIGITKFTH